MNAFEQLIEESDLTESMNAEHCDAFYWSIFSTIGNVRKRNVPDADATQLLIDNGESLLSDVLNGEVARSSLVELSRRFDELEIREDTNCGFDLDPDILNCLVHCIVGMLNRTPSETQVIIRSYFVILFACLEIFGGRKFASEDNPSILHGKMLIIEIQRRIIQTDWRSSSEKGAYKSWLLEARTTIGC